MKLVQIVYRDLLVVARELDRHVAFRALISSNMLVRPVVGETKTRLPHVEDFNRHLLDFLQNKSYYMPSRTRSSVQALVRDKFRSVSAANSKDQKQAMDAALVALKALNDRMAHAIDAGILEDTTSHKPKGQQKMLARVKAKKTKLVRELTIAQALREKATEAPPINVRLADNVTTGVFLLSHPMLNGIFSRSVIVLTEHSSSKGTKGFIVNRPSKVPLMKRFKVHPRIMRAFGSSKVRKGGPLRTDYAEILHGNAALGGERIVASNFATASNDELFQGIDLDTAADAVEKKTLKQSDVVFINGMSSWTPGQLDNEMERGTWVAVRAPLSVAIDASKDLWSELMGRLGGEYEAFSRMPVVDENEEFDDADDDDDEEGEGDEEDQSDSEDEEEGANKDDETDKDKDPRH